MNGLPPVRIQHHPSCSANYPEKREGELAQATTEFDISDTEKAVQCNDCGAFTTVPRGETT